MSFVNSGQTGAIQSAATQVSQRFRLTMAGAGAVVVSPTFLSRGAPRVLVSLFQTTALDPASVVLQVSVSDVQAGVPANRPEWLTIAGPVLTPSGTWQSLFAIVPGKLLRLQATAPAAGGVAIECAIMASL